MKHLLNDLTEKEKNSIREQHTGGMNVVTENFSKLINAKSGDVKPLVSEQPSQWGRDSINRPGSLSNYIEGPGSIGNKDYDPEAKMERQKRDEEDRERRKYKINSYNPKTGREWDEDGLRSYVKNKFDVDLPDEVFSGKGAISVKASNYLENYFG